MVADSVSVLAASGVLLRLGVLRTPSSLVLVAATPVWVGILAVFGLYRTAVVPIAEELRRIVGATSVGVIVTTWMATAIGPDIAAPTAAALWGILMPLDFLGRRLCAGYRIRATVDGRLRRRTLVMGTKREVAAVRRVLNGFGTPFEVVASTITQPSRSDERDLGAVSRVDEGELEDRIRALGIDCVFVASRWMSESDMTRVFRAARRSGVEVRLPVRLPETRTSRVSVEDVSGLSVLALRPVRLYGSSAVAKRAVDIAASSIAIVALFPLGIVIAVAIRLTSPGPVLFRQERTTLGGRAFTMLKFRTMTDEQDGAGVEISAPYFKHRHDPRITRVGAVLRRFSLDEIPQFINVIKGDMSLVGPRPLACEQAPNLPEDAAVRSDVRAGLTGWWQINGRNDVSPEAALRFDAYYVANWSMTFDLLILARTIRVVLGGRGAY